MNLVINNSNLEKGHFVPVFNLLFIPGIFIGPVWYGVIVTSSL